VQSLRQSIGRPVETAVATGWPKVNGFSKTFPVSDHCDFNQLMDYVTAANPKRVFTYHGFSRELAAAITRRLGIPAQSFEAAPQKMLMEFA
jgi:putative mRNA 3-end processing factor